jgi:hypothetical protein
MSRPHVIILNGVGSVGGHVETEHEASRGGNMIVSIAA